MTDINLYDDSPITVEFTFIVDEEQEELETFSLELRRTSGIQPTAFFNGTLDFTIGAGNRVRGGGGGGGGLGHMLSYPTLFYQYR